MRNLPLKPLVKLVLSPLQDTEEGWLHLQLLEREQGHPSPPPPADHKKPWDVDGKVTEKIKLTYIIQHLHTEDSLDDYQTSV